MELKQIKELMAAMGRAGIKRLALKKEGFELQLESEKNDLFRNGDSLGDIGEEPLLVGDTPQRRANTALAKARESGSLLNRSVETDREDTTSTYITSPMVGTFYASPSPEDPHFVKVGDRVEKNSVACIIEAMKVMNEIKAGVSGVIVEIFIESGHPVEFGTKLFRVSPEKS